MISAVMLIDFLCTCSSAGEAGVAWSPLTYAAPPVMCRLREAQAKPAEPAHVGQRHIDPGFAHNILLLWTLAPSMCMHDNHGVTDCTAQHSTAFANTRTVTDSPGHPESHRGRDYGDKKAQLLQRNYCVARVPCHSRRFLCIQADSAQVHTANPAIPSVHQSIHPRFPLTAGTLCDTSW